MTDERRDALARVIDPDSWDLYDDKKMKDRSKLQGLAVRESRETADRIIESGLMAKFEWEPREYLQAMARLKDRTSRRGVCYSVEDGLDGYFMHDPRCAHWPDGAIGGSSCIK